MEQGSPERSPSASSDQTRPLNDPCITNELSLLVNSVTRGNPVENGLRTTETSENRDLSVFLQSRQVQQQGTSFSRAPLFGELLAQCQSPNGNLAAVPMRSHSHDQTLLQPTQMSNNGNLLTPLDRLAQNGSYNNEIMINRYNLPLTNLPPGFRPSTASSRFQGQHIGNSQVNSVPFGNSLVNSSSDAIQQAYFVLQARANATMNGASIPLRARGIQGISNPRIVTNGTNMANGSSSYPQGPSVSGVKRRMVWHDDPRVIGYRNWISFVRGDPRYASTLTDTPDQRYTIYDQRYEAIGQPVDPHLRIFNAMNANGDGGST